MADMVASVPELTMRTISMEGTNSHTNLASVTSAEVGAPKLVPLAAAACTASVTTGWAWPNSNGP